MKYLTLLILLVGTVLTSAQPSGRVDTRKLVGVKNYVQDEFTRDSQIVWVRNSLYYNVTNQAEGLIMVRTNATVLVHIGLPNPTNNLNRTFRITTMGASTATLSNSAAVGTFTDAFTMTNASVYFIASNKTAVAYSTGSNYLVRLH